MLEVIEEKSVNDELMNTQAYKFKTSKLESIEDLIDFINEVFNSFKESMFVSDYIEIMSDNIDRYDSVLLFNDSDRCVDNLVDILNDKHFPYEFYDLRIMTSLEVGFKLSVFFQNSNPYTCDVSNMSFGFIIHSFDFEIPLEVVDYVYSIIENSLAMVVTNRNGFSKVKK